MSIRYRRAEDLRIALSRGDWILVKKHLTAGETRQIYKRMMRQGATGAEIDPLQVGIAKMVAYLKDWSFNDPDGQPVIIRQQSDDFVASALDNLPVDDFAEVLDAITVHEKTMETEREEEKKMANGNSRSEAISPLPESLVGATNGSPN